MVRGLAAATARIRAFSSPGSESEGRSNASELKSPTNTTRGVGPAGRPRRGGDPITDVLPARG